MKKQYGFSLIELLIVIAIILVIASIAIPNLMSARRAANESSAVGSMRTINTGEASVIAAKGVFTCTLNDLGPASIGGMGYLDIKLAQAITPATAKSGYYFSSSVFPGTCNPYGGVVTAPPAAPVVDFSWGADAAAPGTTGINAWCTNTDMVIYRDANALPQAPGTSVACAGASPLVPM